MGRGVDSEQLKSKFPESDNFSFSRGRGYSGQLKSKVPKSDNFHYGVRYSGQTITQSLWIWQLFIWGGGGILGNSNPKSLDWTTFHFDMEESILDQFRPQVSKSLTIFISGGGGYSGLLMGKLGFLNTKSTDPNKKISKKLKLAKYCVIHCVWRLTNCLYF